MMLNTVVKFKNVDEALVEHETARRINEENMRSFHIKFNLSRENGKDYVMKEPFI